MVCLIGSYRCIDWPLVRYVPNHTDIPTHSTVGHIDKPVCIAHTGCLSDLYVLTCQTIYYGMMNFALNNFVIIKIKDNSLLEQIYSIK